MLLDEDGFVDAFACEGRCFGDDFGELASHSGAIFGEGLEVDCLHADF